MANGQHATFYVIYPTHVMPIDVMPIFVISNSLFCLMIVSDLQISFSEMIIKFSKHITWISLQVTLE